MLDPKVEVGPRVKEGKDGGASKETREGKDGKETKDDDTRQNSKETRRERQRLERAIEKCEKTMAEHTTALEALEKELLACAPSDYRRMQELSEKQKALRAVLTAAEEEWLLAHDALAAF